MKKLIISFIFLSCVACVTPYREVGFLAPTGYTDAKLTENKFYIQVNGNSNTHIATLMSYMSKRAKELCEQNGFTKFDLQDTKQGFMVVNGNAVCSK